MSAVVGVRIFRQKFNTALRLGVRMLLRSTLGARRRTLVRTCAMAVVVGGLALWTSMAGATITQGDFSIFGTLSSRWSGRWGLKSSNLIPCRGAGCNSAYPLIPVTYSGGQFDFSRWDLVQARQVA